MVPSTSAVNCCGICSLVRIQAKAEAPPTISMMDAVVATVSLRPVPMSLSFSSLYTTPSTRE